MERSHWKSLSKLSRPATQAWPVRPITSTGRTSQTESPPRTFKPKRPEVGTWKVSKSKVQKRFAEEKPIFDQLLNKCTKVVPKNRSLKKRPKSPLHQGKPSCPRGEFSRRRGWCHYVVPSSESMPPCRGRHRHRIILLIIHGNMTAFGCSVTWCHIHHLTWGEQTLGGLHFTDWHDQCTTD